MASAPPSFRDGVIDNMAAAMHARGLPARKEHLRRMHDATLQDPLCDQLVKEIKTL